MPSPAHETIVRALHARPALLAALAARVLGARLDSGLRRDESTLRAPPALEVRPDAVFQGQLPRWTVVEVQNRADPDKGRRWPLVAAILLNEHGVMGDVLVITASARVAEWAAEVASVQGPLGTEFFLKPKVLLITPDHAESLLDPHEPELAIFAVWSVQRRHGPVAKRIVRRALRLASRLSTRLRHRLLHAIVTLLSRKMLLLMRSTMKKVSDDQDAVWDAVKSIPLSRHAREFLIDLAKYHEKLEGMRVALLEVLAARKLPVSDAERRRIRRCRDTEQIQRWIAQAVVATSTSEALTAVPAPRSSRSSRRPASRRPRAA